MIHFITSRRDFNLIDLNWQARQRPRLSIHLFLCIMCAHDPFIYGYLHTHRENRCFRDSLAVDLTLNASDNLCLVVGGPKCHTVYDDVQYCCKLNENCFSFMEFFFFSLPRQFIAREKSNKILESKYF